MVDSSGRSSAVALSARRLPLVVLGEQLAGAPIPLDHVAVPLHLEAEPDLAEQTTGADDVELEVEGPDLAALSLRIGGREARARRADHAVIGFLLIRRGHVARHLNENHAKQPRTKLMHVRAPQD